MKKFKASKSTKYWVYITTCTTANFLYFTCR